MIFCHFILHLKKYLNMKSEKLLLKLKSKNGQTLVENLTKESTVEAFQNLVYEKTKIPPVAQLFRHGFPPHPIDLPEGCITLGDLKFLKSGDVLIVEEVPNFQPGDTRTHDEFKGVIKRIVVPADNSCLFRSIGYILQGSSPTEETCKKQREIVASFIASNLETYTDAFLGKSNKDYCLWIQDLKSWGGAIEISILSQHHSLAVAVVHTKAVNITHFGEETKCKHRAIILYDGIHYDPLSLDIDGKSETLFPIENESVLDKALEFAKELHDLRQYTDVSNFSLRCLVCQEGLAGQVEAQQHAIATGHYNFGEV